MNEDHNYEIIKILQKPTQLRSQLEHDQIIQIVKQNDFLYQLSESNSHIILIQNLSKCFDHEYFAPNSTIYEQETYGDKLYIIIEGEVGVYTKEVNQNMTNSKHKFGVQNQLNQVKVLRSGQAFGELSLINNRPRRSTVIALTHCHFAVLRKMDFTITIKLTQQQTLLKDLGFFADLQLFENWNIYQIKYIHTKSEQMNYRMGQPIFRQGQYIEGFYIIKTGNVELQFQFRQNGKRYTRKILNIGKNEILALENLYYDEDSHNYSCISSSALTSVTFINKQLFYERIKTNSIQFLQEYCQKQKELWNLRIAEIQNTMILHKKDKRNQMLLSLGPLTKNSYSQDFNLNDQIRNDRINAFSTIRLRDTSSILISQQDKSFLKREKDHSLFGKIQTQKLHEQQYFLSMLKDKSESQSPIKQDIGGHRINLRQLNQDKKPIYSILSEEEKQVVAKILGFNKPKLKQNEKQINSTLSCRKKLVRTISMIDK